MERKKNIILLSKIWCFCFNLHGVTVYFSLFHLSTVKHKSYECMWYIMLLIWHMLLFYSIWSNDVTPSPWHTCHTKIMTDFYLCSGHSQQGLVRGALTGFTLHKDIWTEVQMEHMSCTPAELHPATNWSPCCKCGLRYFSATVTGHFCSANI